MEVYIENKDLEKLYTTGSSIKLKLPKLVAEKFFAMVQKINAAVSIHDFWKNPGFKFEKLKGHKNRYSMRLSGKYRLEMEINWLDKQETIGEFYLKTISKHYGD